MLDDMRAENSVKPFTGIFKIFNNIRLDGIAAFRLRELNNFRIGIDACSVDFRGLEQLQKYARPASNV